MTELRGYRLLLVDDNPVNLQLLSEVIAMHLPACRAVLANGGDEALELARKQEFDGAFVDMQMPGMDGIELCRKLKSDAQTAGIPVVLITAHQSTAELRAEGLDAGAYDFISQPIRNVELVARIKVLLRIRDVEEQLLKSNQGLRQQVARKTEALRWMTGLIAASGGVQQAVSPAELEQLGKLLDVDGKMSFSSFRGEVFDRFPASVKQTLILLSMLDEIPLPLAEKLAAADTVREILDYLERHNFFVRFELSSNCFWIDQPLKGYLLALVKSELSDDQINSLYQTAADWWLEQRRADKTIDLLLRASAYADAERIARQVAPSLYGTGELAFLLHYREPLQHQPADCCTWLRALLAVALLETDPRRGLGELQEVGRVFAAQSDQSGVLFCICQQLKAHFFLDGDLDRQQELLSVADAIWPRTEAACAPDLRIQVALLVAFGHLQQGSAERAEGYLETLRGLRGWEQSPEYLAWFHIVRATACLLDGKWPNCFRELELLWKLECQSDVSLSTRLSGGLVKTWLLQLCSDEQGRQEVWSQLQARTPDGLYQQTLLPHLRLLQEIQSLVSRGAWRPAKDLLSELDGASDGFSPALRCLVLEQRAQVLTLAGESVAALSAVREAIDCRGGQGGWFGTRNALLMATVLYALGSIDECREQLATLSTRQVAGDQLPLWLARWLANRCQAEAQPGIQRDELVRGLLTQLEHLNLVQIPYWFPPVHRQLLEDARRLKPVHPLVRRLAVQHLDACLNEAGDLIPLLNIRVLGDFCLSLIDGDCLGKKDLSSSFRQLLAMLIAAPGRQLSQEEIQAQLWPDSTTERSRSKLDSLLLRLRKTLEGILKGQDVKSYIYLQKGVLCLDCCWIDAGEFERLARLGIRHARRLDPWQAELAFHKARGLWRGELNFAVALDGRSDFYRQDLQLLYLDMTLRWAELLLRQGRHAVAAEVTRQALKYDPTHDHLVRLQRSACLGLGLNGQAQQVLRDYAEALRREGYAADEISETLAAIETDPDPGRGGSPG